MIQRLLYVSRIASGRLPSHVEDILRVSVANNRRDGLTGFLICDGINFVQALEGEGAAVRACFERIASDRRHASVRLRDEAEAPARLFPRWSMCGLYLSAFDDALLAASDIDFDPFRVAAGALWQHLCGLSHRHEDELNTEHARLLLAADADSDPA